MRWNVLPIGLLVLLSIGETEKQVWLIGFVVFLFILVIWACKWEISLYRNKKRELEVLQQKLQSPGQPEVAL